MLRKIAHVLKRVLQMALVVAIGFGISLGTLMSVSESLRAPTPSERQALNNISHDLNHKERRAVETSRQSILHVLSSSPKRSGFAKMSGTYVEYNDRYYVLTAAHGIVGECSSFFVATDASRVYECIRYIIVDEHLDYAIVEIEPVADRVPALLPDILPSNREWFNETAVLTEVFYTGYPNGLGPLTLRGSIAGISDRDYILLHSYAWPGSSGAGVFSYDGNMIGIVIALNVGFTGAGYDVLEDLVIVTPLYMVDWDAAYEIMDEARPLGDTGDTGQ